MSLDFSVADIKGYQESEYCTPPWDKEWHPVTSCLVFALNAIGVNRITEENCEEVWRRIHIYFTVTGTTMMLENGEPKMYSIKEIRDHIGLSTNTSPITYAKFMKGIREELERDAKIELNRSKAKEAAND